MANFVNFSSFLVIRFRYIVIFAVVPIVVALVVKVSVAVVLLLLFKHFFGPTSQTRRGVEKAFHTFDFAWAFYRICVNIEIKLHILYVKLLLLTKTKIQQNKLKRNVVNQKTKKKK